LHEKNIGRPLLNKNICDLYCIQKRLFLPLQKGTLCKRACYLLMTTMKTRRSSFQQLAQYYPGIEVISASNGKDALRVLSNDRGPTTFSSTSTCREWAA
jgi:hypothetical protein